MTFSQDIKEELIRKKYSDNQLKCILLAFLKNNVFDLNNQNVLWEIKTKNNVIIRFIITSFSKLYDINKTISFSKGKDSKKSIIYKLQINGNLDYIKKDLCIHNHKSLIKSNEDKFAFLIGAFLSGGSVNNPLNSNYHFEIRSYDPNFIKIVDDIFQELKIKSKIIQRKTISIVYVKKSENISDVLKYMGAVNSMFIYENKRIYRDYSNQLQRLNNLDISNLKKTIDASNEQIKWIHTIKNDKLIFDSLSQKEKLFCEIRINNPELSLNDVVYLFENKYKIKTTRAGINHCVRKIKTIYYKIVGCENKNP